ncbi:MAG: TonB-dependent receptor [Balneola sp.]
MSVLLIYIALLGTVIGTPNNSEEGSFLISGVIIDKESRETVPFAYVHLEELNRTTASNNEGVFELKNIPEGTFTVSIHRIGYKIQKKEIEVSGNLTLDIELTPTLLTTETIEVIGKNNELTGSSIGHISESVSGGSLRRNLGTTLANTLSNLPGIDQRSLGNTTSRPVIRGLGDERVTILQDGLSTGDVSNQSADHAVSVDPIASSEIQLAKGAAALEFGANAIGGIINVVNNLISPTLPNAFNGSGTLAGQSVSRSGSAAFDFSVPVNNFVLNTNISGKAGGDTKTPKGDIENTQYKTGNTAVGLSYVKNWGYIGGSFSTYLNNYGIPPDPNGHPSGVDIEMQKFNYALKGEYLPKSTLFKIIEADFSINNYNHKEFESTSSIGTEFGLVTTSSQINATHGDLGFLRNGKVGVWGEVEDYAVRGANTPDANSYKLGTFIIEEFDVNALSVETGVRFDYVQNKPKQDDPNSDIGNIRARDFYALSSSLNLTYDIGKGFSIGSILLHSFRAPSLEELYSEGPHLASFSFEIGNPELEPERSLAKEIFTRWQGQNSALRLALYHNDFSNFNYAKNTGQTNNNFPTLNNYQFVGTEAKLYGFEASAETQIFNNFVVNVSASYTIGEQDTVDTNGNNPGTRPLPQIPPFKAKSSLKYAKDGLEIGSRFTFASEQNRTGEFETPTESYFLTGLFAQYRFSSKNLLHTFSLNVNNVFNEEYYNHLSRIKDLRPEPGRNVSLLYRIYF